MQPVGRPHVNGADTTESACASGHSGSGHWHSPVSGCGSATAHPACLCVNSLIVHFRIPGEDAQDELLFGTMTSGINMGQEDSSQTNLVLTSLHPRLFYSASAASVLPS